MAVFSEAAKGIELRIGLQNFHQPGQNVGVKGNVTEDKTPEFRYAGRAEDMGLPGEAGGNYGGLCNEG